jgi:formamidopyrimidine-DNA glycosylase
MPELPDVESFRKYFNATSLHKRIMQVHVHDNRILEGVSPAQFDKDLRGKAFEGAKRHGKYFLAQTSNGSWLVFHFGMTGGLRYYKKIQRQPDHERVRFDFKNGYHLAFINRRLLGHIALATEPGTFIHNKDLGPDALDGLEEEGFTKLLGKSNATAKSVLTDQQKIAGIGNIYADEILFQARIHPQTPANLLSGPKRKNLYAALKTVLSEAIRVGGQIDRLPDSFLIPTRQAGTPCPRCGGGIVRIDLHGRSTYLCPRCQSLS